MTNSPSKFKPKLNIFNGIGNGLFQKKTKQPPVDMEFLGVPSSGATLDCRVGDFGQAIVY